VSVRLQQPATIKVDAITGREYHGHVVEIGSSAAVRQGAGAGIRYFKVKVSINDADDRLRPGMTSQVSIVTSSAPNALAVPIQAVVERVPGAAPDDAADTDKPEKKYVFLAVDGKAKQVEVQTGISDATHVVVTSGVKDGDRLITGPFRTLKKLQDGAVVAETKEEKKTSKDKDEDKTE
jgi:HlyD family secretion protein